MKNLKAKILIFLIFFVIVFISAEKLFYVQNRQHMWEEIYDKTKPDLDILFLGSSMFFRNVNTPLINNSTDLYTGVLGVGNSNLRVALNDLKLILKNKKVKLLCIDGYLTLNNPYYSSKDKGVLIRHNDAIVNNWDRVRANMLELPIWSWPESIFQICRPTLMWSRWQHKDMGHKEIVKDYGFAPLNEIQELIISNGYTPELAQRDYKAMDNISIELPDKKNEKLMRELISIAKENGCEVWLISMPRLDKSFYSKEAKQLLRAFEIAEEYGVNCIELNSELMNIGLSQTDFRDMRHLNLNGANKVTEYLIENYINKKFQIKVDFPKHEVKNMNMEKLEEGVYRYSLQTYGECYYRFSYFKNGEVEKVWEFSQNYYVDLPNELQANDKLFFEIADTFNGEVLKQGDFIKIVK